MYPWRRQGLLRALGQSLFGAFNIYAVAGHGGLGQGGVRVRPAVDFTPKFLGSLLFFLDGRVLAGPFAYRRGGYLRHGRSGVAGLRNNKVPFERLNYGVVCRFNRNGGMVIKVPCLVVGPLPRLYKPLKTLLLLPSKGHIGSFGLGLGEGAIPVCRRNRGTVTLWKMQSRSSGLLFLFTHGLIMSLPATVLGVCRIPILAYFADFQHPRGPWHLFDFNYFS